MTLGNVRRNAGAGRGEQAARTALIAPKSTEGACWMRDPGGPLLGPRPAQAYHRPPDARVRRPRGADGAARRQDHRRVLGTAGSHGTSADIG